MHISNIPELKALNAPNQLIRIPNQIDVPVTQRILKLIDSVPFQRLKTVSQLGVVSTVYPAAVHNRFEHSLGVYRNTLLFLRQLSSQPVFAELVDETHATALIVAALLHDIGHWPFCHAIEDLKLDGIPEHESIAERYIRMDPISQIIRNEFEVDPEHVLRIIQGRGASQVELLLGSILSGPIDVDKLDYLYRDSLHAGVPYGQNFDTHRLISSLCLSKDGNRLAISHKGRTAAELMVFARYVMFSEVYWHHAVRSATAMLQRAFFLARPSITDQQFLELARLGDVEWIRQIKSYSKNPVAVRMFDNISGDQRRLYKRVASFTFHDNEKIYTQVAHRPYSWLKRCSDHLSGLVSERLGKDVADDKILVDAPPVGLEVQFDVTVAYDQGTRYRLLGDVSPVVKTLATEQFDHLVKQVRIFSDPTIATELKPIEIQPLFEQAIAETD